MARAAGLLVARVVSGLGVGAVTATATAWLVELDAARRPHASGASPDRSATAANLGGLGLGGLIAGVLAQWVGHALTLPVPRPGRCACLVALVAIARRARNAHGRVIAAPALPTAASVGAARVARPLLRRRDRAAITFAVFGLITSLAPSFLAGTLHEPSHALAGAVSFAMFATAALAQTLTGSRAPQQLLAAAIPALLVGHWSADARGVAAVAELRRLPGR